MSMNMNRKRSKEDSSPYSVGNSSFSESTQQRNKRVARRSGGAPKLEAPFLAVKRGTHQSFVETLDVWLKDECERLSQKSAARSSNNDKGEAVHLYRSTVAEYRWRRSAVDQRWSESAAGAALVGFGNDDSGQLGIRDPVKEEEDAENFERAEATKAAANPNYEPQEFETAAENAYPPTNLITAFKTKSIRQRIVQVSAGGTFSVFLTVDGNVYTCGCDDEGALGRTVGKPHEATASHRANLVKGFVSEKGDSDEGEIVQIAAGANHILFLAASGRVYMTGMLKDMDSGKYRDYDSQTADAKSAKGFHKTPKHVALFGNRRVIEIATRNCFNAAILEDSSLVTWGFGNQGELGRSALATQKTKNPAGKMTYDLTKPFFYKDVVENGETIKWAEPDYDKVRKVFLTPMAPIYCVDTPKQVLSVSCGSYHLLVVARDDSGANVYSCGISNWGQLGHGDEDNRHQLTKIKSLEAHNIRKVSAGEHHSLALSVYGTKMFGWGRNDAGQLGTGDKVPAELSPTRVIFPPQRIRFKDVVAGDRTSFAITTEGELYSWGDNNQGISGHDERKMESATPKVVNMDSILPNLKVESISAGGQHTLSLARAYMKN